MRNEDNARDADLPRSSFVRGIGRAFAATARMFFGVRTADAPSSAATETEAEAIPQAAPMSASPEPPIIPQTEETDMASTPKPLTQRAWEMLHKRGAASTDTLARRLGATSRATSKALSGLKRRGLASFRVAAESGENVWTAKGKAWPG